MSDRIIRALEETIANIDATTALIVERAEADRVAADRLERVAYILTIFTIFLGLFFGALVFELVVA